MYVKSVPNDLAKHLKLVVSKCVFFLVKATIQPNPCSERGEEEGHYIIFGLDAKLLISTYK